MSETDACPRCGGDCPMSGCWLCGGCGNTGEQPCPACQAPAGARPCEVCAAGPNSECGSCEGTGEDEFAADGRCRDCDGCGAVVEPHCCACGGSPYCTCCPACGAECIAECKCPVSVQRADGSTLTLGAASSGEVPDATR